MSFYQLGQDIGLPIKSSKTVLPTPTLTFLGLELDTEKFEIRLPQDKLVSLREEVLKLKSQKSATLKQLQSLIGMLNFACDSCHPDALFSDD